MSAARCTAIAGARTAPSIQSRRARRGAPRRWSLSVPHARQVARIQSVVVLEGNEFARSRSLPLAGACCGRRVGSMAASLTIDRRPFYFEASIRQARSSHRVAPSRSPPVSPSAYVGDHRPRANCGVEAREEPCSPLCVCCCSSHAGARQDSAWDDRRRLRAYDPVPLRSTDGRSALKCWFDHVAGDDAFRRQLRNPANRTMLASRRIAVQTYTHPARNALPYATRRQPCNPPADSPGCRLVVLFLRAPCARFT